MNAIYKVGKPAPEWRPGTNEGTHLAIWNYRIFLSLIYADIQDVEIQAIRSGIAEFKLAYRYIDKIVWLVFRFRVSELPEKEFIWSDASYSWHLQAEAQREGRAWIPIQIPSSKRLIIAIVLLNQEDGIVRAIRTIAFPASFINPLFEAINHQREATIDELLNYDRLLDFLYDTRITPLELAKNADIKAEFMSIPQEQKE